MYIDLTAIFFLFVGINSKGFLKQYWRNI